VRLADSDVLAFAALHAGTSGLLLGSHRLLALLLRADLAAGSLAGTRVGVRALPTNGKPAAMTKAAIAADLHEPLDVLARLTTEVTFDLEVPVDVLTQSNDLFFREVAHTSVRADAGLAKDRLARGEPNPKDVGQADLNALLTREVDTGDTGQRLCSLLLALALLVTGVLADHEDPAVAPDDLALVAHSLD